MKREMKKYNLPPPEFYEERGNFKVVFRNNSIVSGQQSGQQTTMQYKDLVLNFCNVPKSAKEISEYL